MHSPQSQVKFSPSILDNSFFCLISITLSHSQHSFHRAVCSLTYRQPVSTLFKLLSHNQAYSQTLFPLFLLKFYQLSGISWTLCSRCFFRYLCNFVHNLIWQIGDSNYSSTAQSALSGSGNQARQVVGELKELSEQLARDFSSL